MQRITVDTLTFDFQDEWLVTKLDEWAFYRKQFQNVCGGSKAVDVLALDGNRCAWFIEAKDYRRHRRTKTIDIAAEVAGKVRDSLAGLFTAHVNSVCEKERQMANSTFGARRFRVVLHLEQPAKHSKLFPRAINPANVTQKLKQLIKPIDPHPLVLEINHMKDVAWKVS